MIFALLHTKAMALDWKFRRRAVYYSKSQQGNDDSVRYYSSGRNGKRRSSRTKLIIILGLALAVETAVLLASYIWMTLSENENLDLVLAERKQSQELDLLRPQVEKLRSEIAMLTQSRLPDLTPLEFDKVLPFNQSYAKNIVFTVSGKGDEKLYEYKIVLHNSSLNLIHPQLDILFFDHVGIQVGISRLGVQQDGTPTLEMLDRGEIRSFSSKISLTDEAKPEYFRIKIQK
jgi:hypothetical protein